MLVSTSLAAVYVHYYLLQAHLLNFFPTSIKLTGKRKKVVCFSLIGIILIIFYFSSLSFSFNFVQIDQETGRETRAKEQRTEGSKEIK